MRFKETLSVDEAEVLAGRFSSVSGRHYVLHDPEKLAEKYSNTWNNLKLIVTIKKQCNFFFFYQSLLN